MIIGVLLMKKALSLVLITLLLFSTPFTLAETDLSEMSFEELVALRQEIDLLLFASDEYKQVTVPQGKYTVGVDIPAGTYSLSGDAAMVEIFLDSSESSKMSAGLYGVTEDRPVAKLVLEDGWIVSVSIGNVVFTTYTGLGF